MSATYERELKALLSVRAFYAVRSAGSLGLDLIATRPVATVNSDSQPLSRVVIIEEKSTQDPDIFYVKGRANQDQFEYARRLASDGHIVVYCVRFKSGARDNRWRVFQIFKDSISGPMRRIEGRTIDDFFGLPDPRLQSQIESFPEVSV